MSLSLYSIDCIRISLPPPTTFWKCVFEGMFIWDRVIAELGMEISSNDSWLMGIKNRKLWAKFYRI